MIARQSTPPDCIDTAIRRRFHLIVNSTRRLSLHQFLLALFVALTRASCDVEALNCHRHKSRVREPVPTLSYDHFKVCGSYTAVKHSNRPRAKKHSFCISHQRQCHYSQPNFRMSTRDDDRTVEQATSVIPNPPNESATTTPESSTKTNRSSLSRTLVLAVPLMLKFALVLMIKFLTDLVVFPMLFTYRGIIIMRRRLLKLWSHWTSSPTSNRPPSNHAETFSLEGINPNGSASPTDSNNV
jgi:hypothetical protein